MLERLANDLPALLVVVPLISAPLCVLIARWPRLVWQLCMVSAWTTFAIALELLDQVLSDGTISYAMGGWVAPWGIEYRIDELNAFVALIVTGIAAIVMPFAYLSVGREIADDKISLFYTLLMLCFTGLLGMTVTGDAFNLFVFLEISSLSTYALISMGDDRRAKTAAFQYLVMGTIGGTFVLIGVGFLYEVTGTLNMDDLAQRLPAVTQTRTLHTAFAFLVVGIGLKLAMFPLHLWLPNAYAYAPNAATIFMAATSTKVAVYALLRFAGNVFGPVIVYQDLPFGEIAITLAVLGLLSCSFVAIFQQNVKRMLAYSSVAQIGYILMGIGLDSKTGAMASLLHLFNHALMKAALFMALGCLFYRVASVRLDDLRGIGHRMPWTFAAFVIGGLSLIGVPLTVGFVSKWYLVLAALEKGLWPLAMIVLFGSLLAVMYVWRVVEVAWFSSPSARAAEASEAPLVMLLPTWILVLANLYFGIDTSLTVGVADLAAGIFMEGVQ
jgi:multicomponent Na+:H+ antiporter subunit D